MVENKTMTIEEAIEKLNVLSSYDTPMEKRLEYKQCIIAIQQEMEVFKILKNSLIIKIGDYYENFNAYLIRITNKFNNVDSIIIWATRYMKEKIENYLKEHK